MAHTKLITSTKTRRTLAAAGRCAKGLGEIYKATQGRGRVWRAAVRALAAVVAA
jgi:hypothetical protein